MENNKLQAQVLSKLREEKNEAVIYLRNGFQTTGTVIDFDDDVILVKADNKQQMMYKHIISTIVPAHRVISEV